MAKKQPIVTDPDIKDLIQDKRETSREDFVTFMQERKKLTDEKGHEAAEADLKTKHADAIAKVKEKKANKGKGNNK